MEHNKLIFSKVPTLRFRNFHDAWEKSTIDQKAKVYDGTHQTPIYTKNGVKFVSVENINDLYSNTKFISIDDYIKDFKYVPNTNDILMTRIGDIGTPALVTGNEALAYYVSLALLKVKNLESRFLYHYIQTPFFQKELWHRTLHVAFPKKINKNEIGHCKIFYPSSKFEQNKIANFISLIDNRIAVQNKIIEDLKVLKKELCNKAFSSTEYVRLGDYITEVTNRNKANSCDNVLSVNNKMGFINQSEQFEDRMVASKDKHNYKVVTEGCFAYNPARINVGSIALLETQKMGIISPMYVCFKTSNKLTADYLKFYYQSAFFFKELHKKLEGSVRQCLTYENMCEIQIPYVNVEQQNKIATDLKKFITRITLEEQYLRALQYQKAYFLKTMFI